MRDDDQEKQLEEIWKDDLFNRREEAELLIGYIESVAARRINREDARAYTIAIDAGYGEGKTFFLRRLAKHLEASHPVAFVDAWADDLADEPLTALAATLKKALDPLIKDSPDITEKFNSVLSTTGKVAAIAAKGLFKRGLGLLISHSAVEAAEIVMSGDESEEVQKVIKGELKGAGKDIIKDSENVFEGLVPTDLMEKKITEFESGQKAISEMKQALGALVASLENLNLQAPIVIIIDELDRCRPTYAVKLLEEIKHLFDVQGLVFLFGLNSEQLAHSMVGAYGPNFDGPGYLKRFINREYRLSTPDLQPLLELLIQQTGVKGDVFVIPPISVNECGKTQLKTAQVIAKYMSAYGLSARDAFQVMDILQTCVGVTESSPLLMTYLLPLILSKITGSKPGQLKEPNTPINDWVFHMTTHPYHSPTAISIKDYTEHMQWASSKTLRELNQYEEDTPRGLVVYEFLYIESRARTPLAHPHMYGQLIETVDRFSNPRTTAKDTKETKS